MKRSEDKNTMTKEAPKGQKLGIKCSENEQSSTVLWNINNHQPPPAPAAVLLIWPMMIMVPLNSTAEIWNLELPHLVCVCMCPSYHVWCVSGVNY